MKLIENYFDANTNEYVYTIECTTEEEQLIKDLEQRYNKSFNEIFIEYLKNLIKD